MGNQHSEQGLIRVTEAQFEFSVIPPYRGDPGQNTRSLFDLGVVLFECPCQRTGCPRAEVGSAQGPGFPDNSKDAIPFYVPGVEV